MLWALLDNAVKYGDGAPIGVSVSLVRGEASTTAGGGAGAGALLLRVADAGPGIADADRDRLFKRYARGTTPGTEGTGLGLYVSRELARANGGDLVLDGVEAGAGRHGAGGAAGSDGLSTTRGAAFTLTLLAESPTEG